MRAIWSNKCVLQKGWILVNVIDIREDGQTIDEAEYEKCMMCGYEWIRYVHIVEHKGIDEHTVLVAFAL